MVTCASAIRSRSPCTPGSEEQRQVLPEMAEALDGTGPFEVIAASRGTGENLTDQLKAQGQRRGSRQPAALCRIGAGRYRTKTWPAGRGWLGGPGRVFFSWPGGKIGRPPIVVGKDGRDAGYRVAGVRFRPSVGVS